ncbi:MAG: M48 family metalloprotease [Bdellovibrionales bacterium]
MTKEHALIELEMELRKLMSTSMGRRVFLANVAFLLASCSSAPKTRYREGDNAGQEVSLTVADEKKMTAEVMPEMRKQYPPIQDSELQAYISQLGHNLVAANDLDGNPYRYTFTAVDVPYVNAFALPAGTVFVTAPLIEMADTEAELVGVLGHEVGHIKARHTAERMAKAKAEQSKSAWYAVGGGLLGGALGYGVGKLTCPPRDSKCLSRAAQLGAVAGVGGGLLVQKFAFMANSREDEMEADRIGFKTAVKAGYDKDQVGRFYAKLLKMEQESKQKKVPLMSAVTDAMSTHPPSQERVNQMAQMASSTGNPAGVKVSSTRFDSVRRLAAKHAAAARARKG